MHLGPELCLLDDVDRFEHDGRQAHAQLAAHPTGPEVTGMEMKAMQKMSHNKCKHTDHGHHGHRHHDCGHHDDALHYCGCRGKAREWSRGERATASASSKHAGKHDAKKRRKKDHGRRSTGLEHHNTNKGPVRSHSFTRLLSAQSFVTDKKGGPFDLAIADNKFALPSLRR